MKVGATTQQKAAKSGPSREGRVAPSGRTEPNDGPGGDRHEMVNGSSCTGRVTAGGATLTAVMDRLRGREAEPLELPILQPAEPFLDLAGEDLRRRILLVEDAGTAFWCLRPEFTIPVARKHLEVHGPANVSHRYACAGTVFRRGEQGSSEGLQAGIEAIGEEDRERADARAVADSVALVEEFLHDAGTKPDLEVTLGDQAVFEALTRSLGLSAVWFRRLVRLFGDTEALRRSFDALGGRGERDEAVETRLGADPTLPPGVEDALSRGDQAALKARIAEAITRTGMGAGPRTAGTIAARLLERRAIETARLDTRSATLLRTVLALDVPLTGLRRSLSELGALGGSGTTDLRNALDSHDRRVEALEAFGLDPTTLRFRGALGRPLDYYSGLVFEIARGTGTARTVLGGGGRYDALLQLLGASRPVPAVGFALDMDRILAARASGQGGPP